MIMAWICFITLKRILANESTCFKRFFKSMEDVAEMKLMRSVLMYLIGNPYQAPDDEIMTFFSGL